MSPCARDLAFVRFRAPDLDKMEAYLTDFGLVRAARTDDALYMRGTDDAPFFHVTHQGDAGFIGLAFLMPDLSDLEALTAIEGAGPIEDIDEPGGGKRVMFTDPNGFRVEAVAGRDSVGALPYMRTTPANDALSQPRRGETLRTPAGPAQVKRLGHCVINAIDFRTSEAWYKERFGLVTSDEVEIEKDVPLGAFLRCDQGETYVDHHTLFLVGAGKAGFNHAAFEVVHVDDLMAGHSHLKAQEYEHEWGIGRHVLGSQVFDYWRDPWGHTLEHWTDGDLFNNQTPPAKQPIDQLLQVQWGPEAPPTMGG